MKLQNKAFSYNEFHIIQIYCSMILVLNILLILVYSSSGDATRLQMLEFNRSIKVPYSVLVVIASSRTLEMVYSQLGG